MRGLKLAAAILSIIYGGFGVIGGFIITFLPLFTLGLAALGMGPFMYIFLFAGILQVGLGAAMIVLGAFYCKKDRQKGIGITLIVLASILAVFAFISLCGLNFLALLDLAMLIPIIVFISIYLAKTRAVAQAPVAEPQA
jgi:hypothetical protein